MWKWIWCFSLLYCSWSHSATVGIIADSIGTDSHQKLNGKDFPAVIQERFDSEGKNIKIINDSISGSETKTGPGRLKQMLAKSSLDVLFIGLTINDLFRGNLVADIQANLEEMIKLALNQNIQIIIGKIDILAYKNKPYPPCCTDKTYNQAYIDQVIALYRNLERKYPQVILTPYISNVFVNNSNLAFDYVHPTAQGAELLADYVKAAVEHALQFRYYCSQ